MSGICLNHNISACMSRRDFRAAVEVWVKKPHVINRRLWGSTLLHTFRMTPVHFEPSWDAYRSCLSLRKLTTDQINNKQTILDFLIENLGLQPATDEVNVIEINILKLLPKVATEPCIYQFVAKNLIRDETFFVGILNQKKHAMAPMFPYSLNFSDESITLEVFDYQSDLKSVKWLQEIVLPHIVKWGLEPSNDTKNDICSGSLTLIPNEVYYNKYNELKHKYGKNMVKIWPENTDPAKFVYEDVAIATYLLVLWECERERLQLQRRQSFVDLGCGNGLLVYILAGEGHPGRGIDVRKRNIWDTYPSNVVLLEQTITPSDVHLFPDADWIIGNHSDELTPWIPVIAARSSYKCNFLVLPCCCYNFNGSKYQRKDSSKSLYTEYLDYIHQLCKRCGFKTSVDRMKIPSTKRICLVGTDRTYPVEDFHEMCCMIQGFTSDGNESGQWISDFKPRQATEKVRNCTRIDKSLINSIVEIISGHLIQDCKPGDAWNIGKVEELNDVAKLVPSHMLRSLKSEFGGLQTLLKNHHQIFKIESGRVQLRRPQSVADVTAMQKNTKGKLRGFSVKKKVCWFYNNHPQGCPLSSEDCSFVHDEINRP